MSWLTRYRTRLYFRHSLWILPAFGIVAALVSVSLLARYEQGVGSHATISAETARALMGTIAASTFTHSGDMQGIGGSYDESYEQDHEVRVSAGS